MLKPELKSDVGHESVLRGVDGAAEAVTAVYAGVEGRQLRQPVLLQGELRQAFLQHALLQGQVMGQRIVHTPLVAPGILGG